MLGRPQAPEHFKAAAFPSASDALDNAVNSSVDFISQSSPTKVFIIYIPIPDLSSAAKAATAIVEKRANFIIILNIVNIKRIELGMDKSVLMEILGEPTLIFSQNMDCWCYYYLYETSNKNKKNISRYVVLFFENSILDSFRVKY